MTIQDKRDVKYSDRPRGANSLYNAVQAPTPQRQRLFQAPCGTSRSGERQCWSQMVTVHEEGAEGTVPTEACSLHPLPSRCGLFLKLGAGGCQVEYIQWQYKFFFC